VSVGVSTLRASTRLGWSRTLSTGVLVAGAAISIVSLLSIAGTDRLGWDFRYTYFQAAAHVMDGRSPYPPVDDAVLASGIGYVYPPQFVVALAPLTELPTDLVVWIAFAASVASVLGALAVLGVRDLRCYAALLAWGSTSNALELTNLSAFLVLGIALVWRFRATIWPLAATLGLVVSIKLFGWPLFVWAAATRRYRAALLAVGVGVTVTACAWAIIGFDGLMQYPDLLRRFSEVQGEQNSYSILAASVALGLGSAAGQVLAFLVGCALLAASAYFGRRGDDVRSFAAAIGATLAFSPVLWVHFFVLLAVPLAIARPRFSAVWLLPIALWACPRGGNGDELQVLVPGVVTFLILAVVLARPEERRALDALEVGH
jgi:alpha-1,2-mannosyltransferase